MVKGCAGNKADPSASTGTANSSWPENQFPYPQQAGLLTYGSSWLNRLPSFPVTAARSAFFSELSKVKGICRQRDLPFPAYSDEIVQDLHLFPFSPEPA